MMSVDRVNDLELLATGTFAAEELTGFVSPPAWRKATRNMIMAAASIERALKLIPEWNDETRDATGLVLGSSAGELETSADFLTTLAKQKMARPLLFQNSLHNATTGFASIHFRITGPTFSVSSGEQTPRDTITLAETLIRDESCQLAIVTLVEAHCVLAGFIGEDVSEGAATLILADRAWRQSLGWRSGSEFVAADWKTPFTREPRTAPLFGFLQSSFYQKAQVWSQPS